MSEPPAPDNVQQAADILARNLAAARKARGLTQIELGDRSGLARARINRIEKAARPDNNPTMKTLVALATGLGMAPDEAYKLLLPDGPSDLESVPPLELGKHTPLQSGTLAIELPAGEAFEAARLIAAQRGRPVMLVDPTTREIAGIAGKAPSE